MKFKKILLLLVVSCCVLEAPPKRAVAKPVSLMSFEEFNWHARAIVTALPGGAEQERRMQYCLDFRTNLDFVIAGFMSAGTDHATKKAYENLIDEVAEITRLFRAVVEPLPLVKSEFFIMYKAITDFLRKLKSVKGQRWGRDLKIPYVEARTFARFLPIVGLLEFPGIPACSAELAVKVKNWFDAVDSLALTQVIAFERVFSEEHYQQVKDGEDGLGKYPLNAETASSLLSCLAHLHEMVFRNGECRPLHLAFIAKQVLCAWAQQLKDRAISLAASDRNGAMREKVADITSSWDWLYSNGKSERRSYSVYNMLALLEYVYSRDECCGIELLNDLVGAFQGVDISGLSEFKKTVDSLAGWLFATKGKSGEGSSVADLATQALRQTQQLGKVHYAASLSDYEDTLTKSETLQTMRRQSFAVARAAVVKKDTPCWTQVPGRLVEAQCECEAHFMNSAFLLIALKRDVGCLLNEFLVVYDKESEAKRTVLCVWMDEFLSQFFILLAGWITRENRLCAEAERAGKVQEGYEKEFFDAMEEIKRELQDLCVSKLAFAGKDFDEIKDSLNELSAGYNKCHAEGCSSFSDGDDEYCPAHAKETK